jgi:hypothetical protein
MKTKKQQFKIRQIRSIATGALYVTAADWPSKEIDGVTFIAVKKDVSDKHTYFMRKDGMEYVKSA